MAQIQLHSGQQKPPQLSRQLAKTATAVTLGVSLLVLSGITLSATVIGIAVATPLLVIFSPVLVPAAITVFLISAGLVTAAGLGSSAGFVFYWMYSYVTGKQPVGSQLLDRAWEMVTHAARGGKEKGEELTVNAKGF